MQSSGRSVPFLSVEFTPKFRPRGEGSTPQTCTRRQAGGLCSRLGGCGCAGRSAIDHLSEITGKRFLHSSPTPPAPGRAVRGGPGPGLRLGPPGAPLGVCRGSNAVLGGSARLGTPPAALPLVVLLPLPSLRVTPPLAAAGSRLQPGAAPGGDNRGAQPGRGAPGEDRGGGAPQRCGACGTAGPGRAEQGRAEPGSAGAGAGEGAGAGGGGCRPRGRAPMSPRAPD